MEVERQATLKDGQVVDILKPINMGCVKVLKPLAGGGQVSFANPKGSLWFLAVIEGVIVGCCCLVEMKNSSYRVKSDAVHPSYRGLGIYAHLSHSREHYAIGKGAKEFTCFSSRDSRPQFMKDGYEATREEDSKQITYMRKVLTKPS